MLKSDRLELCGDLRVVAKPMTVTFRRRGRV